MKNLSWRFIFALSIIVLLGIYIWLSTKPETEDHAPKSFKNKMLLVKTSHPVVKPMPLYWDAVGTVEAAQTVSVISQVTGILKQIAFQPGQTVKAGQLLFVMDPSVYATTVAQARANLERDQAQLALLQGNADRYLALAKQEYVTRQQAEEAQASAASQKAAVAADQAQLEQAQIQLGYTQIRAPISGKTSTTTVHPGDLISANSATPLVVINQMDPVQVSFSITQDQLPDVLRYQAKSPLTVKILAENGNHVLAQGNLSIINNSINPQSGAVEAKANIPNPTFTLWPGQLVTVRVMLTVEPNALVIPSQAVQMGQQGNYVYLVKQGKAVIQPVVIARQVDQAAIVRGGLTPRDSVIVEIPPNLVEGADVKVNP